MIISYFAYNLNAFLANAKWQNDNLLFISQLRKLKKNYVKGVEKGTKFNKF